MSKKKQNISMHTVFPESKKEQKDSKVLNTSRALRSTANQNYLFHMSHASAFGTNSPMYQMIPIMLFAAVTIMIVRLHIYSRPMSQFYWTAETDESQLSDFFSYDKMVFMIVLAIIVLIIILFQLASQSLAIKHSKIYIPMIVYSTFVIISYYGSHYKEFALWGYNDRFEGTIPILAYMLMLFYVFNTVNSEKNLRQVFWAIAISSVILSILGITQATGHDFFRTLWGQKLISPNYQLSDGSTLWQAIDNAYEQGLQYYNFTFKNNEVYQTVYNINYVSFYLTLQVPLFGMLFIRAFNNSEEPLWKKIGLGILWTLIIFNFITSNSSGGYLGLAIIGLIGIIMLNKQLITMWKPLVILFVILGICMGLTTDRWTKELIGAIKGMSSDTLEDLSDGSPASTKPFIDYIKTGQVLEFSLNGESLFFDFGKTDNDWYFTAKDSNGQILDVNPDSNGFYTINDERFYKYIKASLQTDSSDNEYLVIVTVGGDGMKDSTQDWIFIKKSDTIFYLNALGYIIPLDYIEHKLFENHLKFGSRRGYIWATSIPMLKRTILKGFGADTFCINYPMNDYAWKYNANYDINIIIDKPHNMYLHVAIGTGIVSLVALLFLYGVYVIQSIRLFWKRELNQDFIRFAGFGLFCGLTAFMITGIVDDSTVSVMPQFYTLLGCGLAANTMIKSSDS